MIKEIKANEHAWGQNSEQHYHHFKKLFLAGEYQLNKYIQAEIGDLTGKKVIHLQCNTGADTIALSQLGAKSVVGVDLVPNNIHYAEKMADELAVENVSFVVSDMMAFMDHHHEKYDVVFVSEGALGWFPDFAKWGRTIRHLMKDDGYFYLFEGHPIVLMFNEGKLGEGVTEIAYPYFATEPDVETQIGGYASDVTHGVETYFWMYKISDVINSLISAGLQIEYFNEFQENYFDRGGSSAIDGGLYNYPHNKGHFPQTFSLKATVR
ncbi:MAG: class I SAM-dependent methyltransferase [Turicibacter sp.]|nr:class I SAM-dependent methyltransferase [Turicibacter sp.]